MILWGGPDGFSKDNVTYLPVVNSVCAQVADLNKDGWPDLIVGGFMYKSKNWKKDSCVSIFWGGPDGFDKRRCTQLPGHASNSITVADFNNDGILDIFITSYNSGRDRDLDAYLYWGQREASIPKSIEKGFSPIRPAAPWPWILTTTALSIWRWPITKPTETIRGIPKYGTTPRKALKKKTSYGFLHTAPTA